MVKTYGLTHISFTVRDIERSFAFYRQVFGVEEIFREAGQLQVQTPGSHDVIVFTQGDVVHSSEEAGGIGHFGFRLVDPNDIDEAVRAVEQSGGTVLRRGEFSPGLPFAFVRDPDDYMIEIWYE